MNDDKELKVLKIGTYTPEDIDREILHEMWAYFNTMVEEYKRQRQCYFLERLGKTSQKSIATRWMKLLTISKQP